MLFTADQLDALRAVPLGALPNRLRVAISMANVKQAEVAEAVGITAARMSKLVVGAYLSLDVELAGSIANFFGCTIEDLFPARALHAPQSDSPASTDPVTTRDVTEVP